VKVFGVQPKKTLALVLILVTLAYEGAPHAFERSCKSLLTEFSNSTRPLLSLEARSRPSYLNEPGRSRQRSHGDGSISKRSPERQRLHELAARGQREQDVNYDAAKSALYRDLYLRRSGAPKVKEVYCGDEYPVPHEQADLGREVNVEHTWPQSRFSTQYSKSLQKGDLHHLFLSNSRANSARSSYPFGEVARPNLDIDICKESTVGKDARGQTVFEPPDEHKGAVARAVFYFAVRYDLALSSEEEAILRLWHRLFPPSAEELWRNSYYEIRQGNRNPFIDDSSLVDLMPSFGK
jgi:hypothetical protein